MYITHSPTMKSCKPYARDTKYEDTQYNTQYKAYNGPRSRYSYPSQGQRSSGSANNRVGTSHRSHRQSIPNEPVHMSYPWSGQPTSTMIVSEVAQAFSFYFFKI